ncbi:MAG: 16S rRNA (cytosine(967)-C(5))-methyltransferase [Leptolyngbyaceae cyanobacterium bins.349]|nr:16S rRNA (cytosine(967)-C(5))-methyltransferase [Leptolyngbyaceae cyanobacterium bins.349]
MSQTSRQLAFLALRAVHRGAFADVAVDKALQHSDLMTADKRLFTELVYGSIRRQRTLDTLIDQLGKKKSHQQPPDLRLILHLGFYQLAYLSQIPVSAAVNTTVELAKQNGFAGLSGVVNGLLRQYLRLTETDSTETDSTETDSNRANLTIPLTLPTNPIQHFGILHSYPDWIIAIWLEQFGHTDTEQLCQWMNQPPTIDLRVNRLQATIEQVEVAFQQAEIQTQRVPPLPDALRLLTHPGSIQALPGFREGWWMVQDSSAQLVSYLLDPQPGETVIDACAAPGGKTAHLAEMMADQGIVWACDKTPSRLKKLEQNRDRLQLHSIRLHTGDSRTFTHFQNQADRVLLDAPCSGLGTLHRHADARWRQTPDSVAQLAQLQTELFHRAATWVKPDGSLVYATCTLHPAENEQQIDRFLQTHPNWQLIPPAPDSPVATFATANGWCKVLPHQHQMDGFFMALLKRRS